MTTDDEQGLVGPQRNSLFGIVRPATIDAVLADLAAAGYGGDDVHVVQQRDVESWRANLEGGNLFKRLHQLLGQQGIDMGMRYTEQRPDETVIRVRAPNAKAAEPAREVLHNHGGYFINYFGTWAHET